MAGEFVDTDSDAAINVDSDVGLVDGTEYILMNTGGGRTPILSQGPVYVVQLADAPGSPPTQEDRKKAVVLRPGWDTFLYTPVAGENLYAWSPEGGSSLSVNT